MGVVAHRMTRIYNAVTIRQPPAVIFDHITTPTTWTTWVPITLGLARAIDHQPEAGGRLTEEFAGAGVKAESRGRCVTALLHTTGGSSVIYS